MTDATHKYQLIIKTTGSRMLYPIINTFCSDSGLNFNDAKDKMTSGAALEFSSKEQADTAAAKYRKLGCSVTEEPIETTSEETGVARVWICAGCGNENKLSSEKCDCGYNLYQGSNEPLCTSTDNKPVDDSEEVNTGFAGIGKRIEDLKMGGGTEDPKAWKQAIAEPEQKKQESVKQETTQKVYTPKAEKKPASSFRLSFTKVFWGIIAIVIIALIFSQNNDKRKATYAPSGGTFTPSFVPTSNDGDTVTVGQYRCSQYHNNKAQELQPSVYEKQSLESESSALGALKIEIETAYVDHYSQSSIDQHNMLIDDYNSRLELYKLNLVSYNNKVETYNNYLMSNCSKAY